MRVLSCGVVGILLTDKRRLLWNKWLLWGVAACFLEHYDEEDASREELDQIAREIRDKM